MESARSFLKTCHKCLRYLLFQELLWTTIGSEDVGLDKVDLRGKPLCICFKALVILKADGYLNLQEVVLWAC